MLLLRKLGLICDPEERRSDAGRHWKIILHWLFPVTGLLSLLWFLVRVIPKPSRAAYPCMRVAAPLASSFVVWLVGVGGAAVLLGIARQKFRTSKFAVSAFAFGLALIIGTYGFLGADRLPLSAYIFTNTTYETSIDPINDPIGVSKGFNPGRVVWVHDPGATDWEGPDSGESCWEPEHTDQDTVDSMMSRVVILLAGKQTEAEAWDVLFKHFNYERGKGDIGYQEGDKIAIKINLTTSNASSNANMDTREKTSYLNKAGDTLPPMVLALLRQLVYVVGVAQPDISVGDPVAYFTDPWYIPLASEFPDIQYLDHYPFPDRVQVQHSTTPFFWSTTDANSKLTDHLPVSFAEADYIINFAVLKGHSSGITVCAKNHYGSLIRNPVGFEWDVQKNYYDLHESLPNVGWSPGRGYYRALVDLMGHRELGAKTLLYLIDGLYGGYYWEGTPYRWTMPPFNGDWPSSLFASQDPVAIDSVAYDFLYAEWPNVVEGGTGGPGSLEGGAQDYLHEAALADDPPSGTSYDPENDGKAMDSLGVHEHWNNAVDKQYSRNMGLDEGIELVSGFCDGDFDEDFDIDGKDLAFYILNQMNVDLEDFAAGFGKIDCL